MKIIVCMKQVPDTTEVRLDPVTNTLIRDGVPSIINPDDKCGIEAALQIKEKVPGTTVTVVSMGLPSLSEYELWRTDEEEFALCARIVHGLAE